MTTYIAKTRMRVGRGEEGNVVDIYPGEPVPEAANWQWQTIVQYVKNGHLLEVPDLAPARPNRAKEA